MYITYIVMCTISHLSIGRYIFMINIEMIWVGEWLLFSIIWAISQLYHFEKKLYFREMFSARYKISWRCPLCTRPTRWIRFWILLAHRNNRHWVDMSLYINLIPCQPVFAHLFNTNCIEMIWVGEWLLFSIIWAISQLYHFEKKLYFREMITMSVLY
jgi:hypothetical protein